MLLILLIYASFALDFLVFPIPSEVSTWQINQRTGSSTRSLPVWCAHAILLVTWAYPLYYALIGQGSAAQSIGWWTGIVLAVSGRMVTLRASHELRNAAGQLVTSGLFAVTRHPIVVGLHLTLLGLLLTTGQPVCLILWFFSLLYFDYKIDLEERGLRQTRTDYRDYELRSSRYPCGINGFNWKRS